MTSGGLCGSLSPCSVCLVPSASLVPGTVLSTGDLGVNREGEVICSGADIPGVEGRRPSWQPSVIGAARKQSGAAESARWSWGWRGKTWLGLRILFGLKGDGEGEADDTFEVSEGGGGPFPKLWEGAGLGSVGTIAWLEQAESEPCAGRPVRQEKSFCWMLVVPQLWQMH